MYGADGLSVKVTVYFWSRLQPILNQLGLRSGVIATSMAGDPPQNNRPKTAARWSFPFPPELIADADLAQA